MDEEDEYTVKEIVNMIVDAFDFKGEVIYDSSKSDGQYKKTVSNKKLRSYLPDFKFMPMKEGIKETADWLAKNYNVARLWTHVGLKGYLKNELHPLVVHGIITIHIFFTPLAEKSRSLD